MRLNNASANTKKSVELNNFLGVDFSSAPTNVSTKRASFAKNLVSENGVNQKRPGWETLIDLSKLSLDFGGSAWDNVYINGIFKVKFKLKTRFIDVLLVQVNGIFFELKWDNEKDTYISKLIRVGEAGNVTKEPYHYNNSKRDFKSQAFLSNNRLYIIGGGGYFVYYPRRTDVESFELAKDSSFKKYNVDDLIEYNGIIFLCKKETDNTTAPPCNEGLISEYWYGGVSLFNLQYVKDHKDTYIPTTTIGILPNESNDTSRISLDRVNLLSSYRYNKLRGVDSSIEPSKTSDETPVEYYSFKLDADSIRTDALVEIKLQNQSGVLTIVNTKTAYGGDSYQSNLYIKDDFSNVIVGWIDGNCVNLINTLDIAPLTTSEDNIIVKYSPYLADDSVVNCEFGCRFGYQGNDTLFLSGNKNFPNQDFYSYTVKEDFTYFPADNIEKFGTTPVKAYLRVTDGTLAILKETSNRESSIYYRSVSHITNSDGTIEIQYPVVQGASGEGAINAYTCETLVGDSLFVSSNGIFGLSLSENVVINDRYARERDKFIHAKLVKHDLTKAVSTVFKGKYLLAVDNVCYVMDSRFKSTSQEDADDTYSYECWFWDNIPATYFCSYGDELYFGTDDGKVCKFKQDDFTDDKIVNTGIVSVTELGGLIISDEYAHLIKNGNKFRLNCTDTFDENYSYYFGIYSEYITESHNYEISDDFKQLTITFLRDVSSEFKVGQELGVSYRSNGETLLQGVYVYSVKNDKLVLYNHLGIHLFPEDFNSLFIFKTNSINKWLYITDHEEGESSFRLADENGNIIPLHYHQNTIPSYLFGEIFIEQPVQATWQSAVLDLGLYDYSKNLDSLSVVLSPDYHGKVRFGYETKKVTLDLMAKQIKSAETEQSHHYFDFDNIDFDNFTFETAFATSYTKRIRERNINYIMFKAVMDDEQNSALMSIKVDYTIYKKNRGVR